ncbi:MAG: ubiquinol-cytochrome c reductase iron-sulfur subunit [Actinobacteria bacterium]|nr:ubiquinol-cytochrome c reductase iron-sulfur subunit [Actinomycetota bacterium]
MSEHPPTSDPTPPRPSLPPGAPVVRSTSAPGGPAPGPAPTSPGSDDAAPSARERAPRTERSSRRPHRVPAPVGAAPDDGGGEGAGVTRRSFLKAAGYALGAVAALEVGGVALAYLQPRAGAGQFGGPVEAGAVDDFPPGSVTQVAAARSYVTRMDDGGFLAVYQRCTHLGCTVPYDEAAGLFVCPCHNSQFDDTGEVLSPPAPRPLDLFAVSITDGVVVVDTSAPIARGSFTPDQVAYP